MDESRILARFDLREALRSDATATIRALCKLGVELGILSGDRPEATERVARQLDLTAKGGLLPDDKLAHLETLQCRGQRVAMVGDGVNDVPILAAADVGIAVGSASDLAQRSADVRLVGDQLDRVPELLEIACDTRWRIRTNLLWAFGFNSVDIVLAAFGVLTPVFAAIAMVLSSLTVVRISRGAGRPSATEPRNPGSPPRATGCRSFGAEDTPPQKTDQAAMGSTA